MRKLGVLLALVCVTACAKHAPANIVTMSCDQIGYPTIAVADTISKSWTKIGEDSAVGAGSISGRIVNAHTGEVLQGVAVSLRDSSGRKAGVLTTVDGQFSISRLPPGYETLEAQLIGFRHAKVIVDTRVGRRAEIALAINPLRLQC